MHVLWRVIVKEFLQLRQDQKMIPIIFVAPVVQLLALRLRGEHRRHATSRLVLVDQDRSAGQPRARRPLHRAPATSSWSAVEDAAADIDPWLVSRPRAARARDRPRLRRGAGRRAGTPRCRSSPTAPTRTPATVALGYALAHRRRGGRDAGARASRACAGARRGTARRAAGPHRAGAARLVQPRPQEPLVLRAGGAGHDPDAHDHAALRDGAWCARRRSARWSRSS